MATSRERTRAADAQGLSERSPAKHLTGGGTSGNERLTTAVGATLIVLLAVIGLTLLRLHGRLLSVHLFVGMLLVPPVLLKLASTGYRFIRYYTGNPRYREHGPPAEHRKQAANRRADDDSRLPGGRHPSVRAAELVGRHDICDRGDLGRRRRREPEPLQEAHCYQPFDREREEEHQRGGGGDQQAGDHHLLATDPLRQPSRRPLADRLRRERGADDEPDKGVRRATLSQEQWEDRQQRPDSGAGDKDRGHDSVKRAAGPPVWHPARLKGVRGRR